MRYIKERGLELVKHFEGCKLKAYKDPVGIWTIGCSIPRDFGYIRWHDTIGNHGRERASMGVIATSVLDKGGQTNTDRMLELDGVSQHDRLRQNVVRTGSHYQSTADSVRDSSWLYRGRSLRSAPLRQPTLLQSCPPLSGNEGREHVRQDAQRTRHSTAA